MNVETVKEIVADWCDNGEKIRAIKILRADTSLGLIQAKNYLEEHGRTARDLQEALIRDFCKNPRELLAEARAQLRRQLQYIEGLVMSIGNEEVPQALLDSIKNPPMVTLSDLVVLDILHNGESLFGDRMLESPGEHIIIEIHNTSGGKPIATHKVVSEKFRDQVIETSLAFSESYPQARERINRMVDRAHDRIAAPQVDSHHLTDETIIEQVQTIKDQSTSIEHEDDVQFNPTLVRDFE